MSEELPVFVLDDSALLALGAGNSRCSWLVTSQDAERLIVPLLSLHVAGRQRAGLAQHVGALEVSFFDLSYAGLVACEDSDLPPGAAHALLAARAQLMEPVFIATAETGLYKGTGAEVLDVNP